MIPTWPSLHFGPINLYKMTAPITTKNDYLYHSILDLVHESVLETLIKTRRGDVSVEQMKTLISDVLYSFRSNLALVQLAQEAQENKLYE